MNKMIRLLLAALLLAPLATRASDVSLMPVSVKLDRLQDRATVQVMNNGSEPVTMQAEAISWTRVAGQDQDGPTSDIIVNPPVFTIQPGQTQVLRLGLRRAQEREQEGTYRVVLREVPVPRVSDLTNVAGSVRVLMALRVPVYVVPSKVQRSERWQTSRDANGDLVARVANTGNVHLKIGELSLKDAAGATLVVAAQQGATSVIFPGEERSFLLRPAVVTASTSTAKTLQVVTDQGPQQVALSETRP